MRFIFQLKNILFVFLLAFGFPLSYASDTAQSSEATGFDAQKFVCPLGGAEFSHQVGYSSLVLVQFPDGSWLGDVLIDAQIPECPVNGLPLIPNYDDPKDSHRLSYITYTPEQLDRLPALIGSEAFRALRDKTRHERAQWLATQLEMSSQTRWQLLKRGSWAVINPVERKRVVTRIAEEGPSLIDMLAAPEMFKRSQRLLVANALRELARFDEANALLDSIAASIPADADIKNLDNMRALTSRITQMRDVIAYRDDDRFPIGLSNEKWIGQVCRGGNLPPPYGPKSKNAESACERRQREMQSREESLQEATRLREKPEELDRQCQNTPLEKRQAGLAQACEYAQYDRDSKAGHELVLHQARRVAEDCEATPELVRKGPLFYACISYQSALESALARLLVDDNAGYGIICNDGRQPADRASFANMACSSAENDRRDRAIEKLLAAPASLDMACAAKPKDDRALELSLACSQRHRDLWQAKAEQLAADPAAYKIACATIDAQHKDPMSMDVDEQEVLCDDAKRVRERNVQKAHAVKSVLIEQPADKGLQINEPSEVSIYDADSELRKVALESAQGVVAKAKKEETYPKRKRGDIY